MARAGRKSPRSPCGRLRKVVFLLGGRGDDCVLRPVTRPFSVELPGIERAAISPMTCGNDEIHDAKQRETTYGYARGVDGVNTTELPQSWYPYPRGSGGEGSYCAGTEWASGLALGDRAVWDGGRDLGPCRFPAAGR